MLEDDVADLQDEVEEVETDIQDLETANALQDDRLNTMEEAVIGNVNEIDGTKYIKYSLTKLT